MLPHLQQPSVPLAKVVMAPHSFPPVAIPGCRRVHRQVRTEDGSIKSLPVLECPASHRTYMFIKKLVHEKSRVMIMLAVVMREVEPGDDASMTSAEDQSPRSSSSSSSTSSRGGVLEAYERVVIKVTDRNYIRNSTELIENPLDEISAMIILSSPGHPNVLEVLDYMQDDEYLYVVMPYLRGKDLFQRLEGRGRPLSERSARRIFRQILDGLSYMKSTHRVAHRDLSLENIMFDADGTVKIIDLGMCIRMPQGPDPDTRVLVSKQARRGKPGYVCVEVAREMDFDAFAADMWSCGVILFIMLTLTPLYGQPEDSAWRLIVEGQMDVLLDHYESLGIKVSPLARDLITGMMNPNPDLRLTLEQVRNHPWTNVVDSYPPPSAPVTTTTTTTLPAMTALNASPAAMSGASSSATTHQHQHYCKKHYLPIVQSATGAAATTTAKNTDGPATAHQHKKGGNPGKACFLTTDGEVLRSAPPAAASGGLMYPSSAANTLLMMDEDDYYYHN